jgi:hypothetical protein
MTLNVVAVIFGVFAIGLIVLLIYKSTLTMHSSDLRTQGALYLLCSRQTNTQRAA